MKARPLTTLAALLLALTSWAYDVEIGGIYYELDSSTMTATVASGDSKYQDDITIPGTITYSGTPYFVTSIGEYAFSYCYSLTSVSLPNSLTTIESYAFYKCTRLTSINIPTSVTSIGERAFSY